MGAQVLHNAFLNVKLGLWFQFSFHPRSLNKQTQGKNPTIKKEENTCREFRMGLIECLLLASTKTHEHQQLTTREFSF